MKLNLIDLMFLSLRFSILTLKEGIYITSNDKIINCYVSLVFRSKTRKLLTPNSISETIISFEYGLFKDISEECIINSIINEIKKNYRSKKITLNNPVILLNKDFNVLDPKKGIVQYFDYITNNIERIIKNGVGFSDFL
jgi:hypothetical protein